MKRPEPFLTVRVHDLTTIPSITGLCVGYELGKWRAKQLADHVMEWLPEFALTNSEVEGVHSGNMVAMMKEAAQKLYATKKFSNRGEFGEIFLHIAIRQVFDSVPAISKIYYKSSRNETVKGFDAVHVIEGPDGLELWLGEAKFYEDVARAIRDVVDDLNAHTERDYLRDEFLLITGKIDPRWRYAAALKSLLSPNTSLDDVFKAVSIPVLLTYDSACVGKYKECSDAYAEEFRREVLGHYEAFRSKRLPNKMNIHLLLLPLELKARLIEELDQKLRGWQDL